MIIRKDIISVRKASESSLEDTIKVGKSYMVATMYTALKFQYENKRVREADVDSVAELLKKYEPSPWSSFLEDFTNSLRADGVSIYLKFAFKLLYKLHLGTSKLMRKCTAKYLSSTGLLSGGPVKGGETFLKIRERVFPDSNLLLESVGDSKELRGTRIRFVKVEA